MPTEPEHPVDRPSELESEADSAEQQEQPATGFLSPEDLEALVALETQSVQEAHEAEQLLRMDEPLLEAADIDSVVEAAIEQQAARAVAEGVDVHALDDLVESLSATEAAHEDAPLTGESLDDVLAGIEIPPAAPEEAAAAAVPPPPTPTPSAPEEDSELEISEEFLAAVLQASGAAKSTEEIGSENLAAAATSPAPESSPVSESVPASGAEPSVEELSQEELDALIERAQQRRAPIESPTEVPEVPAVPAPKRRRPRKKGHPIRALVSLAAGIAAGAGAFWALLDERQHIPLMESVLREGVGDLANAMERAQILMDEQRFDEAVAILDDALARAPEGPLQSDASFLRLEARFLGFEELPGSPEFELLQMEIAGQVERTPNHPRTAEALHWRAQLYLRDDLPYAAQDIYAELVKYHSGMTGFDQVLVESAALALEMRDFTLTAENTQRLMDRYPASRFAGEARLLLARSYAAAGMRDEARTLFIRAAQNDPRPEIRGEAVRRLGELFFDTENYEAAIRELNAYLNSTLSTVGNDEAYLLLGRAQHAAGQPHEARDTLNDVLNFFPKSEVVPDALLELSRVYETLGARADAIRIAQQAAARFPGRGEVFSHLGMLLGLDGRPIDAANALVAAEEAGAATPAHLLTAARHFRTGGETDRALDTYDLLRRRYPTFPEAHTGAVENAQIRYSRGEVSEALDSLENLLKITATPEQQLPVLIAAMLMYEDLGLHERVAELARQVGAAAEEPEELARAAQSLFETGLVNLGQEVMARLPIVQLPDAQAYALLNSEGRALLNIEPRRALERLEEAYLAYPQSRTLPNDMLLLKAYLDSGRSAAARRIVTEMQAHVEVHPVDAPYLVDAAILYGDALFAERDFRAAADTYAIAQEAAEESPRPIIGQERDPRWAAFQRANALLALNDFRGSRALFMQIAVSDSPWADEARVKADYAQLEQRLRGEPVALAGETL